MGEDLNLPILSLITSTIQQELADLCVVALHRNPLDIRDLARVQDRARLSTNNLSPLMLVGIQRIEDNPNRTSNTDVNILH